MSNDVKKRVTVTKTMPMSEYDQAQRSKNAPVKPKTIYERAQEMKEDVMLKYLQQRYDEILHPPAEQPYGPVSTNGSLIKD
jgi:hypothetical protein